MVRKRSELLFYRLSEIMARSEVVEKLQPDLVLCIHLNAAPWADPDKKELVDRNDFHVLVNGCYMGGEIAYDNQGSKCLNACLTGGVKSSAALLRRLQFLCRENKIARVCLQGA